MVLRWVTSGMRAFAKELTLNENHCVFLEGDSEKALLQGLLPRLLDKHQEVDIKYIIFASKHDLEKNLYARLKGWLKPDSAFVVLVDQDAEDCEKLKARLCSKCVGIDHSNLLIRIACRELESWYFGDLAAVEKALGKSDLIKFSKKRKYREPDSIQTPSQELRKITGGEYQKIAGSRAIAPLLSLRDNMSPSFQTFVKGIQKLCSVCDQRQS